MNDGIRDILSISMPVNMPRFETLLGDGQLFLAIMRTIRKRFGIVGRFIVQIDMDKITHEPEIRWTGNS